MSTIAKLNVRLGMEIKEFEKNRRAAKRKLKKTAREFQDLGNTMTMGVSVPIFAFLGRSAQLWDKQSQAIAQVEAGLKSTGGTVGFTRGELEKMASEIQNISTIGDEDLLKDVTAQLLTFTNVTGEQFQKAQLAAANLATKMDKGLKESALQLGKALNDPIKGVSALAESGIQFTDSQKKVIKSLVETGKTAEAQNIILKELETQFGGAAEAAAKAGLGPMRQFQNTMGDIMEELGQAVVPLLNKAAQRLKQLMETFSGLDDQTKNNIVRFGLLAAAIGPGIRVIGVMISTGLKLKAMYKGLAGIISIASTTMKLQSAQAAAGTVNLSKMQIAVNGLGAAWKRMDLATKATAIGLVVAAVAAAVVAFDQWAESTTAAAKAQAAVSTAVSDASVKIEQERIVTDKLFSTLKNTNEETGKRKQALEQLQKMYPNLLTNLSVEKSSLLEIASAQRKVNEELIRSVALQQKNAAAAELAGEIAKRRIEIDKLRRQQENFTSDVVKSNIQLRIDAINDEMKGYEAALSKLDGEFERVFNLDRPKGFFDKVLDAAKIDIPIKGEAGGTQAGGEAQSATIDPESLKAIDETSAILDKLDVKYGQVAEKQKLFGEGFDANAERANLLKGAMLDLLENGMSPNDEAIQQLKERYDSLNIETLEPLKMQVQSLGETVVTVNQSVASSTEEMASRVSEGFNSIGEVMANSAMAASNAMQRLAASGETSFKKLGKAALAAAADEVRGAIMSGVANVVKSALSSVPFPFNIAIGGAAGAAAGVLFNKALSGLKIPALAQGGIATAPTLAMVGDNRSGKEAIIPLEKFPQIFGEMGGGGRGGRLTGEIKWNGRDFVIGLREAEADMARAGG